MSDLTRIREQLIGKDWNFFVWKNYTLVRRDIRVIFNASKELMIGPLVRRTDSHNQLIIWLRNLVKLGNRTLLRLLQPLARRLADFSSLVGQTTRKRRSELHQQTLWNGGLLFNKIWNFFVIHMRLYLGSLLDTVVERKAITLYITAPLAHY